MTGLSVDRTHRVSVAAPFPWLPLARSLAAHAVPGLETLQLDSSGARLSRLLPAPGGPVLAKIGFGPPDSVVVELTGGTGADDAEVLARVRSWLDLDAPAAAVDRFLSGFPLLEPLVRARPGLRIPGSVNGFETAVLTVLGQQVSLAAARTFGARLVAAFGIPGPGGFFLFPPAQTLAEVGAGDLQAAVRITGSRARTITALAAAVAEGLEIRPGPGFDAGTRDALLALPGIGPWTVDYLAVRAVGDRNAFVPGDLVLRRALGVGAAREAAALADPWQPWRAYALFHLWTAAAYDAAPPARSALREASCGSFHG